MIYVKPLNFLYAYSICKHATDMVKICGSLSASKARPTPKDAQFCQVYFLRVCRTKIHTEIQDALSKATDYFQTSFGVLQRLLLSFAWAKTQHH